MKKLVKQTVIPQWKTWLLMFVMMFALVGCDTDTMEIPESATSVQGSVQEEPEVNQGESSETDLQIEEIPPEEEQPEVETEPEPVPVPEPEPDPVEDPKIIVIDAGHQGKGNSSTEPNGPGSTVMKAKVASGTTGRFTGVPEYVLTLEVALKLESVLLEQGYEVIMIRDTHDIDISNAERAIVANEANADAFVRIHANGSEDASVEGAFTICQTAANPYNAFVYAESRLLSEKLLEGFIAATGAKERAIWETDTMTGTNWCTVPTTIIEMGFMTNEKEDRLMQTEDYQWKMVNGMADGLAMYFEALG